MRYFAIICVLSLATSSSFGAESKDPVRQFDSWNFPGAVLSGAKADTTITAKAKGATTGQTVEFALRQYRTNAGFREVLAFYIRKSGLKVPNDNIVGRDFPGDKICIPAHFSRTDCKGESPSVTLLHDIRKHGATATFLITNHPEHGAITISISRAAGDEMTTIHLVQHAEQFIK